MKPAAGQTGARNQDGFLLLGVLFMTLLILLALSLAAPKMAEEVRRDKEAETIHRGQQYARAIRMFYTKYGRYPSKVDDLIKTQDQRFLRKRYLDPMTGKDDWRIIHLGEAKVGPMGFFGQPMQNTNGITPTGASSTTTGTTSSSSAFGSSSGSSFGSSSFGSSSSNSNSPFGSSPSSPTSGTGSSPFGNTGSSNSTTGGTDSGFGQYLWIVDADRRNHNHRTKHQHLRFSRRVGGRRAHCGRWPADEEGIDQGLQKANPLQPMGVCIRPQPECA